MRPTVGFALCGSFCTFRKAIDALRALTAQYTVVPIFSDAAWETDTRFGASADFRAEVTALCGTEPLHTLAQVEPLGPKHLLDLLIVAPCTGNTLGKLANGIADSPVSFACKAHLRNGRPVLLAVSTNDGLSGSAANLGALLARNIIRITTNNTLRCCNFAVNVSSSIFKYRRTVLLCRPSWNAI